MISSHFFTLISSMIFLCSNVHTGSLLDFKGKCMKLLIGQIKEFVTIRWCNARFIYQISFASLKWFKFIIGMYLFSIDLHNTMVCICNCYNVSSLLFWISIFLSFVCDLSDYVVIFLRFSFLCFNWWLDTFSVLIICRFQRTVRWP